LKTRTLEIDRDKIKADGADLGFITVSIIDERGHMVPRSKNRLHFTVSGPGEIVATDNGDATDHTSFQSKERNTYNGLALVIVRSIEKQSGIITLTAASQSLISARIIITSE